MHFEGDLLTEAQRKLIHHVVTSVAKAEEDVSKLPAEILQLDGMSQPKTRHFLNNLCSLDGIHYLEIGAWKGSTLISA